LIIRYTKAKELLIVKHATILAILQKNAVIVDATGKHRIRDITLSIVNAWAAIGQKVAKLLHYVINAINDNTIWGILNPPYITIYAWINYPSKNLY